MKVLPLTFIWCISFVTMAITCMNCDLVFWLAFFVFAADNIYMGKNTKRFEREIDELFGK